MQTMSEIEGIAEHDRDVDPRNPANVGDIPDDGYMDKDELTDLVKGCDVNDLFI